MTIVVETGQGVSGANSYVSETDAVSYLADRGIVVTAADMEPLLFRAMDYIDTLDFVGAVAVTGQSLAWPRRNVAGVAADEIPDRLRWATVQMAHAIQLGASPSTVLEAEVKREKVDVIEREFFESRDGSVSSLSLSQYPMVYALLKPYLQSGDAIRTTYHA